MEKKRQGRPKKIGAIYPGGQKGIQPDESLDISNPPKGGSGMILSKEPLPDLSKDDLIKTIELASDHLANLNVGKTDWRKIPNLINGLYPCPKCGSTEIHQTYVNRDTEKLKYCNQCNYLGPTAPTYEKAAELWNEAIEKG